LNGKLGYSVVASGPCPLADYARLEGKK